MRAVKVRKPYIKVTITSVEGDVLEFTNVEFGGDIISLATNKTLGNNVAGGFNIVMIARRNFLDYYKISTKAKKGTGDTAYEVFRPGTLVDIEINGREVMLGIVDSISRKSTMGAEGKPARQYAISGRDLGAFLIDHKVWWDNCIRSASPNNFALASSSYWYGSINAGSPAELIEKITNVWFYRVINNSIGGQNNTYKFADGTPAYEKLITLREDQQSFQIRASKTVQKPDGTNQVIDGEPIGTMKGPGALSNTTYGNYYLMTFDNWNYQGDLFNFLKTFVSSPFNELYVDTGDCEVPLGNPKDGPTFTTNSTNIRSLTPDLDIQKPIVPGKRTAKLEKGKAYVIFRPTPFDDLNFGIEPKQSLPSMLTMQDLVNNDIDDTVIVSKDLRVSKNDLPTFFAVFPAGSQTVAAQGRWFIKPAYNYKALARYGYNPMEVKLDSFNLFAKSFNPAAQEIVCDLFQQKLMSWFANADKFLVGTFLIMGDEKIRVGQRLTYNRMTGNDIEEEYEEGYYYITGVSHSYNYAGSFTTTLTVDRGVSKKIVGEAAKETPQLPSYALQNLFRGRGL